MHAHLKAIEALINVAFPIGVVLHVGIRTKRVGTDADLFYGHDPNATLGGRINNLTPILYPYDLLGNSSWNLDNLGISPETTSRSRVVTGRGAMKVFSEYTVLDEVHFSSEVRSSREMDEHGSHSYSQSSWQTNSILGDTLRFCPVGPLPPHPSDGKSYNTHLTAIGLRHSSGTPFGRTGTAAETLFPNRDKLKDLHLPPLIAPRLNPGRMTLDTVVLLPGYESKDLPKLVKANLLKHLPRLDDRDFDSGNPGYRLSGFQRSQLMPPEDLLAHYGMRVLSDCVEIALEAEVSVLSPKHQTHEGENGAINKNNEGATFTEKKVRQRRTVYIGFANPNWSIQSLNNNIDESERAARRIACGFSRETLKRSLPTPIIEASRLLAQYSRRILQALPPPNSRSAEKYEWLAVSPTYWLNLVLDVSKIPRLDPNPVVRDSVLTAMSHFAPPSATDMLYQWMSYDEHHCPTVMFEHLNRLASEGQARIPDAEAMFHSLEKKGSVDTPNSQSLPIVSQKETEVDEMRRLKTHLLEWTLLSGHAYVPDGFPPHLFSSGGPRTHTEINPHHQLQALATLSHRSDRRRPYAFPNIINGRRENMLIAAALADEVIKGKLDAVRRVTFVNSNLLPYEIFMGTHGPTREVLRSLGKVVAAACQDPPNFMSEVSNLLISEEEKPISREEEENDEEEDASD
eukprot:Tbor_TRINITY_DN2327_c0_g1::TRINITY_DN2327_c0_g1_i1::g.169::m.169